MKKELLARAKRLDTIDAIVGPVAALCMWSGSELLYDVGVAANIVELAALKLPFVIDYVSQTKDKKASLYWGLKQAVATTSPMGSLIDLIPSYTMRTGYILSKK